MYDEEVCDIFEAHGAKAVRGTIEVGGTVYLSEDLVMKYVQMAPSQFTQLARNPANNVIIGGNRAVFAPVYGPPFAGPRPRSPRGHHRGFSQLCQAHLHDALAAPFGYGLRTDRTKPVATRCSKRHMLMAHIKYSDKAFMGSVTDPANAVDSVKIAEIVFGAEKIRQTPGLLSLINVSSPLLRRPHAGRHACLCEGTRYHDYSFLMKKPFRRSAWLVHWRSKTPKHWLASPWHR